MYCIHFELYVSVTLLLFFVKNLFLKCGFCVCVRALACMPVVRYYLKGSAVS